MKESIRGKGAVGIAIAYYSLRGMVSIPLEPSSYNLIYDDSVDLHKIKVISCSYKTSYGVFSASIRTMGGNQPNSSVRKFDASSCDLVFVVTSEWGYYEIPADAITSTRQISLNKYEEYEVAFPS